MATCADSSSIAVQEWLRAGNTSCEIQLSHVLTAVQDVPHKWWQIAQKYVTSEDNIWFFSFLWYSLSQFKFPE